MGFFLSNCPLTDFYNFLKYRTSVNQQIVDAQVIGESIIMLVSYLMHQLINFSPVVTVEELKAATKYGGNEMVAMEKTFPLRRKWIQEKRPSIGDVLAKYPIFAQNTAEVSVLVSLM